jgi:hypothetical protein
MAALAELTSQQNALSELPGDTRLAFGDGTAVNQSTRLGDRRLPSNQRRALASRIGMVQGNHHLQNLLVPMDFSSHKEKLHGQAISGNYIARSVQSVAEAEAGTPRAGAWAGLSESDRQFLQTALQRGDRSAAIRRMMAVLRPRYLERVRLQVREIPMDGDAEPFVPVKDGCDQRSETNHWQHHTPDEIRVMVRINPRVFTEYTLPERVIRLHTTLAHELTHVEQFINGGIDASTRFRREGDLEFLSMATIGEAELVGALQEIDAVGAEIENMATTHLTETELIRHAVNYLWENYTTYRRSVAGRVDSAIANRVYLNVQRGRQALYAFIDSEPGYRAVQRTVRQSAGTLTARRVIENWLYMCPRDYSEGQIRGFVTDALAIAMASQTRSQETVLRGRIPAITASIARSS